MQLRRLVSTNKDQIYGVRELSLNESTSSSAASSSTLLRWRVHFGSSLDRCLILAATSSSAKTINPSTANTGSESTMADDGAIHGSLCTNGGLKLRVVWTISSLIAASAWHYLLQPIIAKHMTLESLVLTDADRYGVLRMDREQLDELRMNCLSVSTTSKRTMVHALSMRLWYAPVLELSRGVVLKGATLVAIRPNSGGKKDMLLGWIEEAFDEEWDGMYAEAVRMLVKRRTYCLGIIEDVT